ncbi:MAG: FIST signal transduction protein [Candidatus Kapaibacteriota bacterium]|jgi:hypothetical protein
MKLIQLKYSDNNFQNIYGDVDNINPNLYLCFSNKKLIADKEVYSKLLDLSKDAVIVSCSTSGEINNKSIVDNSIVITGIEFEKSSIKVNKINVRDFKDSYDAGKSLATSFDTRDLKLLFIISDGQLVNGGDLVIGLNEIIKDIPISGGLAGDDANFQSTLVGLNDDIDNGNIVGIGFYGNNLQIGVGSKGGWDKFGPLRTITKSDKNVLFEIDGENALDLYKKYLGDYAEQLPGAALLFPLAIIEENGNELVRTILSIDNEAKSMTFAGNVPVGAKARLMKSNLDDLVEAAADAASLSNKILQNENESLSILISCVGRKLIFGYRIEEEIESAREILGDKTLITGFYSYGEIAPFSTFMKCELHNQTMTITTISEN